MFHVSAQDLCVFIYSAMPSTLKAISANNFFSNPDCSYSSCALPFPEVDKAMFKKKLRNHTVLQPFNDLEKKGKTCLLCPQRAGQEEMSLNRREGDSAEALQNFTEAGESCRSSASWINKEACLSEQILGKSDGLDIF